MNRYALISAVTQPVSAAEAQAYSELEALSARWRLPSPLRELTERERRNEQELARLRAAAPTPGAGQLQGPLADWLGGLFARFGGAKL